MSINPINLPSPSNLTWSTVQAQEKEAEFLSLRLLNKRTRVRLSEKALDINRTEGQGVYFAVSNTRGWFAAIGQDAQNGHRLLFSTLSDLRTTTTEAKSEGEVSYTPKRILPLTDAPTHLTFASNGERLIVAFSNGGIALFDTGNLFSEGSDSVGPLQVFPPSPPGIVQQLVGNPGDLPDLVAVRREASTGAEGLVVEVLDARQGKSIGGWSLAASTENVPTAIAWSAKGKQIALGLRSGQIVTFSPTDTQNPKLHIPRPPSAEGKGLLSLLWLSNQAFYGIYIAPENIKDPEAPLKHILTIHDPKTNAATQTEFETPYFSSPGLRPPGPFPVVLRNWDPTKLFAFIADSTSSDIGLIGNVGDDGGSETWCNLSLEETSTPSVPLNQDAEDTVPLALDLDVTLPSDDQEQKSPVLYLYASDGTLQAWFISNSKGGQYPGMILPSVASAAAPTQTPQTQPTTSSAFGTSPQPSAANPTFGGSAFGASAPKFGQASTPAFGQTGFGTTSALQPTQPAFGQPSFAQPAFGQSAFGQASTSSPFGANSTASSAPGNSGGFGAFSSGPAKFGSSAFGSTSTPQTPPGPSAKTSEPPASPEADMEDANTGSAGGFGGLSLGESNSKASADNGATNKMFGSFAQPSTGSQQAAPAFGGGSPNPSSFGAFGTTSGSAFMKPASGFGAFASKPPETPKQDSKPPETPKPASAFGSSGFGSQPSFGQSAFGQPSFGQPAFGQSSFGKSAFGAPVTPSPSTTPASSGGFGSFAGASKGFGSFASNGTSAFGKQASSLETKPSEAPSISMAPSTDSAPKSAISEDKPESPFAIKKDPSATTSFGKTSSAFGIAPPTSSPFGAGASSVFGSGSEQKPNVFATPTQVESPTSSPENSPILQSKIDQLTSESPKSTANEIPSTPAPASRSQSTTPLGTPAPALSFTPAATPPVGGAFGNLKISSSAFSPSEGFGAFGVANKLSSSSPFANPKPGAGNAFSTPAKPVSAFGAGGFGAASTTPTFGSPSTPGGSSVFGKSSFGVPPTPSPGSTTPKDTPPAKAVSAFSKYSGSSGGFNAFAKGDKPSSFSDLLSKGAASEDEKKEEVEKGKDDEKKPGLSREDSSFVSVHKPEEEDNFPPTPSTHGTFEEEEQDLGGGEEGAPEEGQEHDDADSFVSEAFSEGSGEKDGEAEEGELEGSEEAEGSEDDGENEEEEEEEDVSEEDSEEEVPPTKDQTPQREVKEESTSVAESPSVDKKRPKSPPAIFGKAQSSSIPTLFGKPTSMSEKSAPVVSKPASPPVFGQPAIKPPSPGIFSSPTFSPSPFNATTPLASPKPEEKPLAAPMPMAPSANLSAGFGLGRPGSRPTKSSPLAAGSLSDEPKAPTPVSGSGVPKARPASPKLPFGQLPPSGPKASGTPPQVEQPKPSIFGAPKASQGLQAFGAVKPSPSPPLQAPGLGPRTGAAPVPAFAPGATAGSSMATQPIRPPIMGGQQATQSQSQSAQQQKQPAQTTFESSMQKECQSLYLYMNSELEQLHKASQAAAAMRINIGRPARSSHTKEDLADRSKWCFGDLEAFAKIIKSVEQSVILAIKLKDHFTPIMREIESNLLKVETLKEEIVRFSKAKADPEFARLLKERRLGPDAAEIQSQLRKQIRLIDDRVQQLEGHLSSCKKKLEERRKGKSSIKPPSLDTLNRTFRNIDVAIDTQVAQIEELTRRVAKFNVNELDSALRGSSYSAPRQRRPYEEESESISTARRSEKENLNRSQVTPSIAASTAAALNAERNALRLKNALAKTRKAPVLNTSAVEPARRAPTLESFKKQEQQHSTSQPSSNPPSSSPSPDTSFEQSQDRGDSENQRRHSRQSQHAKPVKLGRTHTRVPSAITNFDWGPLPQSKPSSTLPFGILPRQ